MLPKENRLTKFFRSDKAVVAAGVKAFCVLNGLNTARFGISIQSGVLKKAVWRNRCKRLIREFLRKNLNHFKTGYDVWILVRSGNPDSLFKEGFWKETLTGLLERLGIYVSGTLS